MKLLGELIYFKKVLSGVVFLGKENAMEALDMFIQEAKELENKLDSYEKRLGINETFRDMLKNNKEYFNYFREGYKMNDDEFISTTNKDIIKFIKAFNNIAINDLENMLEYLEDCDCLNGRGKEIKSKLWKMFIKTENKEMGKCQ